ncbi:uncharacterized protein MYCFIDRAFT_180499 [Pseudocercospora fijiensis CIRAD86]|uniref:Uncharacterized protein n=1 Tax=Pseudocercospora fijiensis (strain CIRAD86) TaxID=383855 RepID=M3AHM1_PSEFD|nr:uncharacterized protein MYCFIDRAFT_180499 [Pseudocercospora fijiensis CIRAD86]EME77012.1 hypothetical protein MYCFIDRAFT_180499 [Pseudocercospora fijiensis CIRAD86]
MSRPALSQSCGGGRDIRWPINPSTWSCNQPALESRLQPSGGERTSTDSRNLYTIGANSIQHLRLALLPLYVYSCPFLPAYPDEPRTRASWICIDRDFYHYEFSTFAAGPKQAILKTMAWNQTDEDLMPCQPKCLGLWSRTCLTILSCPDSSHPSPRAHSMSGVVYLHAAKVGAGVRAPIHLVLEVHHACFFSSPAAYKLLRHLEHSSDDRGIHSQLSNAKRSIQCSETSSTIIESSTADGEIRRWLGRAGNSSEIWNIHSTIEASTSSRIMKSPNPDGELLQHFSSFSNPEIPSTLFNVLRRPPQRSSNLQIPMARCIRQWELQLFPSMNREAQDFSETFIRSPNTDGEILGSDGIRTRTHKIVHGDSINGGLIERKSSTSQIHYCRKARNASLPTPSPLVSNVPEALAIASYGCLCVFGVIGGRTCLGSQMELDSKSLSRALNHVDPAYDWKCWISPALTSTLDIDTEICKAQDTEDTVPAGSGNKQERAYDDWCGYLQTSLPPSALLPNTRTLDSPANCSDNTLQTTNTDAYTTPDSFEATDPTIRFGLRHVDALIITTPEATTSRTLSRRHKQDQESSSTPINHDASNTDSKSQTTPPPGPIPPPSYKTSSTTTTTSQPLPQIQTPNPPRKNPPRSPNPSPQNPKKDIVVTETLWR